MPAPAVRLRVAGSPVTAAAVAAAFTRAVREQGLPGEFPADVVAAATAAASRPLPARADATDVELLTIDPPGSMDLDQALHVERRASGFRLHYAIADVSAFVTAGDPVDREARGRGSTLYAGGDRIPLHPEPLGEGAASLLPGVDRPAVLWRIDLDAAGEPVTVDVRRATVRSRARLTYQEVQHALDAGAADEVLLALREVGRLRDEREVERGAVSLRLPEQELEPVDGGYRLALRAPLPVEGWNAQVSLLTGICAARLMLDSGTGLLRTLPPPDPRDVAALRTAAASLQVDWPEGTTHQAFLRGLDPAQPRGAALLHLAARLLRGAGYLALPTDTTTAPRTTAHSAVASPYAHVTAPLRRLADRFATECALSAAAGEAAPDWAVAALPELPGLMAAAASRQRALDAAVLDSVEAAVLEPLVGSVVDVTVVISDGEHATVQLPDHAVTLRVDGAWPLGEVVPARVVAADPRAGVVEVTPA
jgi:exoribonuclease R